jgi:hypothetical protein
VIGASRRPPYDRGACKSSTCFNRAYDRRRQAAAVEATAADAGARRSSLALAKLQALGKTADESANALAGMTAEQIDELLAHE